MLNVACFVQSRLTDADFVIFSNYCLIGTRRKASFLFFSRQVKLAGDYLAAPICPVMRGVFGGLHLYLSHLSVCFSRLSTSRTTSVGIIFSSFSTLRQRDSSAEMWARC